MLYKVLVLHELGGGGWLVGCSERRRASKCIKTAQYAVQVQECRVLLSIICSQLLAHEHKKQVSAYFKIQLKHLHIKI
jgi:hypothetical protein